jgi:trigger factor
MRRAITQQAMRFPGMERRVIEHFQGSQEAQAELRAPLLEDKIVDYILELAQVSERTVTPEELFKSEEADTALAKA